MSPGKVTWEETGVTEGKPACARLSPKGLLPTCIANLSHLSCPREGCPWTGLGAGMRAPSLWALQASIPSVRWTDPIIHLQLKGPWLTCYYKQANYFLRLHWGVSSIASCVLFNPPSQLLKAVPCHRQHQVPKLLSLYQWKFSFLICLPALINYSSFKTQPNFLQILHARRKLF